MLRLALSAVLLMFPRVGTIDEKKAAEKPAAESRLKQFQGVWVTTREHKEGEKVHQYKLVLEFKGDQLTFFTEREGKKGNQFTLTASKPETDLDGPALVEMGRLILTYGSSKYSLYYDFVKERLVLVGKLPNRPFEGFSLSGDFARIEK
jgi:hypothetical protein